MEILNIAFIILAAIGAILVWVWTETGNIIAAVIGGILLFFGIVAEMAIIDQS